MSPGAQPLQPLRILDARIGLRTRHDVTPSHPEILGSRHIDWPDEAACAAWARQLADRMAAEPALRDVVIELHGTLAAGKTTFARHLLRALGVTGRIKSPSFSVVETYELADALPASHFDFYRFDDPREWVDAGLRDVFAAPGLKLVEWPEKASGLLPTPDLRLDIALGENDRRQVVVQACSERGQALLG